MTVLWYCERNDLGFTLIADVAWLFWNAIKGLARNAENWSATQ
jgi:hypothetical protein